MNQVKKMIYIGNIPSNCTHEELVKIFSPYGPITHIKIPHNYFDPETQLNFAFVQLESIDQMNQAVAELHHTIYQDQSLLLKLVDEAASTV